jgi:hypothetical protein
VLILRELDRFDVGSGLHRQGDYSEDLSPAGWGSGVSLHSSNPEPLVSALGHKPTSEHVQSMPAYPRKRT